MNEFFFEFAKYFDMVFVRLDGLMCLLLLSHQFFSTKIHFFSTSISGIGLGFRV